LHNPFPKHAAFTFGLTMVLNT